MSAYPGWLQKFLNKMAQQQSLKKEALDKLPEDELNGVLPGMNPTDPAAMGQPMPMDPSMMAPAPEPEPDVSGNVFEVDVNGIKVKLKLVPEFVMTDGSSDVLPQPQEPAGPADPMADQSLNPNADPMALAQWMEDPNNEKAFGNQEQGTVEPLSQEDQGIPVHDTGSENELAQQQNEPKVPVHKKPKPKQAAASPTPGADMSTPYYPCAVCANYDAANNKCVQGLDVEKVQAAKSCSWLNSNFRPFGEDGQLENSGQKDGETYNSDINKAQPGQGEGQRAASKNLKDIWRK